MHGFAHLDIVTKGLKLDGYDYLWKCSYVYVLYVYTYAHLSFKKGTDPTQACSRALVDIYKMEKFSVYTPGVYRNFKF